MKWILVVLTLALMPTTAEAEYGKVSWYSTEACQYNPDPRCPTADGSSLYKLEQDGTLFAAKWDAEFGSRYRVCNVSNGKCVVVSIRDRGAAKRLNRAIDLSKKAFAQIADPSEGIVYATIVKETGEEKVN